MSVQILTGDCRDVLKLLPDASVHCCVTSPPYFGLRDYGMSAQIGLEQTPAAFVAELVAVFREVRRVLRDEGTLWLNIGDSYAGIGGVGGHQGCIAGKKHGGSLRKARPPAGGLAPKNLIGIPWRVAFALQDDGWILRQDIIWSKPNPMPESVTDRCTKAHEYVFLLSKSQTYHCDMKAIAEPASDNEVSAARRMRADHPTVGTKAIQGTGFGQSGQGKNADQKGDTRNKRSVWTIATQPYSEAHFATMAPELAENCIKAGCPVGGVVLDPFGGAGTTGLVADRLQRSAILIELNPAYSTLAGDRIAGDAPLFAEVQAVPA